MGCYEIQTTLTLFGVSNTVENLEEIQKIMHKIVHGIVVNDDDGLYELYNGFDLRGKEWYCDINYHPDSAIINFSKHCPDIIFKVEYIGEEYNDNGEYYVKNGEIDRPKYNKPVWIKDIVTIISIFDMEVIYINGICKKQEHSLCVSDIIDILMENNIDMGNIDYYYYYLNENDLGENDDLQAWGNSFPEQLTDFTDIINLEGLQVWGNK